MFRDKVLDIKTATQPEQALAQVVRQVLESVSQTLVVACCDHAIQLILKGPVTAEHL